MTHHRTALLNTLTLAGLLATGSVLAQGSAPAAAPAQGAASHPSKAQLAKLCAECLWVAEVRSEERKGKASGLGVVGGAVLGGLLGNQVGGGTGKKLATVGGAVAGGYAGNEVEKNMKKHRVWIISLIRKDGSMQTHEQGQDPNLRAGDIAELRDGQLHRR